MQKQRFYLQLILIMIMVIVTIVLLLLSQNSNMESISNAASETDSLFFVIYTGFITLLFGLACILPIEVYENKGHPLNEYRGHFRYHSFQVYKDSNADPDYRETSGGYDLAMNFGHVLNGVVCHVTVPITSDMFDE